MSIVAVGGSRGVYIMVASDGTYLLVDGSNGKTGQGKLSPKPVLPLSIACSEGGGQDTCLIADAAGNAWHGIIRGGGTIRAVEK